MSIVILFIMILAHFSSSPDFSCGIGAAGLLAFVHRLLKESILYKSFSEELLSLASFTNGMRINQSSIMNWKELNTEPLPEEEPEPRWRKWVFWGIGLMLILLIISLTFVTFPVDDILKSKLMAAVLKEKRLETEELSLIFEKDTYTQLKYFYLQEQKVEWSACLSGEIKWGEKKTYHLTSIYQPPMHQQVFNQVSFTTCFPETLVILHSHPYGRCIASEEDLNTLRKSQQENPLVVMVIMCELEEFGVYS